MKQPASTAARLLKPAVLVLVFLMMFLGPVVILHLLPPPAPVASAARSNPRLNWYLRSGQWRADAQTLIAVVRYLASPEPPPLTNQPALPA
jgi:hypothetical protein